VPSVDRPIDHCILVVINDGENPNLALLKMYLKVQYLQQERYEAEAVSEKKQEEGGLHIAHIQGAVPIEQRLRFNWFWF
jgi:hypothetical protein